MSEVALPAWAEEEIIEGASEAVDLEVGTWRKILRIGRLLSRPEFPKGSRARTTLKRRIAEAWRTQDRSQENYCAMWGLLSQWRENGELRTPDNLHPSTVYELAKRGADVDLLKRADSEGWTLKAARAFFFEQAAPTPNKSAKFWGYMSKHMPKEVKRLTAEEWREMPHADQQQVMQELVAAAQGFGRA